MPCALFLAYTRLSTTIPPRVSAALTEKNRAPGWYTFTPPFYSKTVRFYNAVSTYQLKRNVYDLWKSQYDQLLTDFIAKSSR